MTNGPAQACHSSLYNASQELPVPPPPAAAAATTEPAIPTRGIQEEEEEESEVRVPIWSPHAPPRRSGLPAAEFRGKTKKKNSEIPHRRARAAEAAARGERAVAGGGGRGGVRRRWWWWLAAFAGCGFGLRGEKRKKKNSRRRRPKRRRAEGEGREAAGDHPPHLPPPRPHTPSSLCASFSPPDCGAGGSGVVLGFWPATRWRRRRGCA